MSLIQWENSHINLDGNVLYRIIPLVQLSLVTTRIFSARKVSLGCDFCGSSLTHIQMVIVLRYTIPSYFGPFQNGTRLWQCMHIALSVNGQKYSCHMQAVKRSFNSHQSVKLFDIQIPNYNDLYWRVLYLYIITLNKSNWSPNPGYCAIYDIHPQRILNTNLTKSQSSITSVSFVQSFWNFVQTTVVILRYSV